MTLFLMVDMVRRLRGVAGSCWGQSFAITGGMGALGSLVGSWAAALGATHVTLMSRSRLHDFSKTVQASASSQISIISCDVSLQGDSSNCLRVYEGGSPGPQHIVHASEPYAYLSVCAISSSTIRFCRQATELR